MSHKLIAVTLLACSSFVGIANAADGTLNFTGTVTADACIITPGSSNQTVALGTVSSNALAAVGDSAASTTFDVVLTSCPEAALNASVKFDGPTNADNSSLLALTNGADVATGVGIGLYEDDSSTLIPPGSASLSKTLSATDDTTFRFVAKYVATGDVTAGTANAVSDFTVIYN